MGLDVKEGKSTDELCLNDGTDVGKVCPQVMLCVDVGADAVHLAEVLIRLTNKLFGFAVVCGVFVFFGKGLGVWDEVEVAEALFALACEVDGHHFCDFIIAGCVLGVDEWVMVK